MHHRLFVSYKTGRHILLQSLVFYMWWIGDWRNYDDVIYREHTTINVITLEASPPPGIQDDIIHLKKYLRSDLHEKEKMLIQKGHYGWIITLKEKN